ncbi:interleukin-15 isoform X2 [Ranitomeya imitator]|uniref:interleukin-15 isoform X2 n=1 Tax=Ranitomeya imitator TaxID=111125 RepID=UPI001AAB28C0
MNSRIVLIFNITLSFASNYGLTEMKSGKLILKELKALKEIFKSSKYWKDNYQMDLKLYTAKVDDYTGTCTKSIFECFYKEFEVLLEEISLLEEKVAKNFSNTLQHMRSYYQYESSKMPNTCKKCEEYEEKSIEEFIKSFESIAQKMNAK